MLILGRRLDDADYPDNIPSLLMEVVEVAQIRGSSAFAWGLQRILQRLLPLPGRRPYETAEEAVADLRQLLRREMGADVCQKALLEFIQQLHPAQPVSLLSEDETLEQESAEDFLEEPDEDDAPGQESPGQESIVEFELDLDGHVERREDRPTDDDVYELSSDDLNEEFGSFAAPGRIRPVSLVPPTPVVEESVRTTEATPDSREIEPTDVSAPSVEIEAQYELEAARETEAAPIAALAPIATSDAVAVPEAPALENAAVDPEPQGDVISSSSMVEDPEQVAPASMDAAPSGLEEPVLDQAPATELSATDAWTPEPAAPIFTGGSFEAASAAIIEETPPPVEAAVAVAEAPSIETIATASEVASAPQVSEEVEEIGSDSAASLPALSKSENRRRKRHQQKSARARKDKLRSTASKSETITAQTPPVAAAVPVAPPPSAAGTRAVEVWLADPAGEDGEIRDGDTGADSRIPARGDSAAAVCERSGASALRCGTATHRLVYAAHGPATACARIPGAGYTGRPDATLRRAHRRASLGAPANVCGSGSCTGDGIRNAAVDRESENGTACRLRAYDQDKACRARRRAGPRSCDTAAGHLPGPDLRGRVPARVPVEAHSCRRRAGSRSNPRRARVPSWRRARQGADRSRACDASTRGARSAGYWTASAGTGQILIKTEPGGASVLLDGKPAGESPVTLSGVAAGRHVLTLLSSSGSVKRTVKVIAGKSVSVEVPIYSGWVSVLAPFVVDVAENGKSIGSTEQDRVMLAPGEHHLVLTNADLGYRAEQDVTVAAGETNSVRLEPTGHANINAIPWAEVWSDGRKIGDTPIANFALPLGSRELVFKHPQFGERKVSATIRAGEPVAVAVDFTKPQQP